MGLFDALGDLAAFASNPYGVPAKGEWNLIEGSFINSQGTKCIFFFEKAPSNGPISQIIGIFGSSASGTATENPTMKTALEQATDGGGRRIAVYEYAYKDGQALKDLGRRGQKFAFNIKFHGSNYQVKFKEFIDVVANVGGPGKLSHPVLGKIPAQFLEWEFVHRYDEFNAVTIRATFLEDNTSEVAQSNLQAASPNSALRSAMQAITTLQSSISQLIFDAEALTHLPAAVVNAMQLRLHSITGQVSRFLGSLAATFSSDAQLQALASNAAAATGGNITQLSSGTTPAQGTTPAATLPPVYQVGFSVDEQDVILQQQQAFVQANQITSQQAVFLANQIRIAISAAIAEAEANFELLAFDITLQYRELAVQVQQVTESCVAAAQSKVKIYSVPFAMSLRMVAFNVGLDTDRQNDIESLNPYLASVNYVPAGTVLVVPVS